MLKTLRLIVELLERRERWWLGGLLFLTVLVALLQVVGVASIMPFMSMVADPELIHENRWMNQVYQWLGFASDRDFLFASGLAVLLLIAGGNALSAFSNWCMLRFAWGVQNTLSVRLLTQYLNEPYSFYLNRNTANLATTILAEVAEVINGAIVPGLKMIAQGVVAMAILALLVVIDPNVAVIAALLLSASYGSIYLMVRRKQLRLGKLRHRMNRARFRLSTEALAGIKETKVLGREWAFLERFSVPAREYSRANASNAAISELPKYALETLAFGGILILVLYQMSTREDFGQAIAIMSLYALAGYRLMPSLQLIFHGLAKLRFSGVAVNSLHADLRTESNRHAHRAPPTRDPAEPLEFERDISIEGVSFRYPNREEYVIRGLDLKIPKNSMVGFVGSTGSGKTTLVDILLGLLEPERGCIWIDDTVLRTDNVSEWRRKVGYVPQHIFLCDDTIAANIAFGIPEHDVDHAAVERAARIANVHEFITTLPDGYRTVVGDRGVRLSGGQRQRIGIARALYHNPDVIIMDEATSALDGVTEEAVMEAIGSLMGQKTIILIAHRLSTLVGCDTIFVFENGRLSAQGSYGHLFENSDQFRSMARANHTTSAVATA